MRISDWSSDVCSSDLELRAFTSRWDTRGDIPLEPPPLIPLGAQGIYPVDVNLHVQPPGRFLAHVGFPPHPAPIGVDILDLGIEDVHLVEELQVHDVEDVGGRDRKSTRLNSSH